MADRQVPQDDPHRRVVRVGDQPVGILDRDYAWPARPIHDVAYAVEYVAPFRDARQLAAEGRQPQAAWEEAGVLGEVARRIRWSRAHRHLLH